MLMLGFVDTSYCLYISVWFLFQKLCNVHMAFSYVFGLNRLNHF